MRRTTTHCSSTAGSPSSQSIDNKCGVSAARRGRSDIPHCRAAPFFVRSLGVEERPLRATVYLEGRFAGQFPDQAAHGEGALAVAPTQPNDMRAGDRRRRIAAHPAEGGAASRLVAVNPFDRGSDGIPEAGLLPPAATLRPASPPRLPVHADRGAKFAPSMLATCSNSHREP